MKTGRKTLSILLALMLVLCLTVTAFADDTYSIEIQNAVAATYNAYKIFDVATDSTTGAYSYTITGSGGNKSPFYDIVSTYAADTTHGITLTPDSTNTTYTVTVDGSFSASAFAEYLDGKIKESSSTYEAADTEDNSSASASTVTLNVTSSGAGYYLVTGGTMAYLVLDTVNGAVVETKSALPSVEKEVKQGDGDWSSYTAVGTDDNNITYRITVNTGTETIDSSSNIIVTDTLPDGIALPESVAVQTAGGDKWTSDATTTDYTFTTDSTGHYITITLNGSKLKDVGLNKDIWITYTTSLNTDKTPAAAMNTALTNSVQIEYNSYKSGTSTATVKTFQIGGELNGTYPFQKVDASTGKALAGAEFQLERVNSSGETEYAIVNSSNYLVKWTKTAGESTNPAGTTVLKTETNTNNSYAIITVKGVDAGEYILRETKAPDGYNLMKDYVQVYVDENNNGKVTYKMSNDISSASGETITVTNEKGSVLPSTGGIGTTIFYVVGGLMVFGAAVLLITKKRMSAYEE